MAKKKGVTATTRKKRRRRSDEQMIEDLKARIEELRVRKEARARKSSPAMRAAITALRQLEKARQASGHDGAGPDLQRALDDARRPLADYFRSSGVPLPKPRGARKGRARRGDPAGE